MGCGQQLIICVCENDEKKKFEIEGIIFMMTGYSHKKQAS